MKESLEFRPYTLLVKIKTIPDSNTNTVVAHYEVLWKVELINDLSIALLLQLMLKNELCSCLGGGDFLKVR